MLPQRMSLCMNDVTIPVEKSRHFEQIRKCEKTYGSVWFTMFSSPSLSESPTSALWQSQVRPMPAVPSCKTYLHTQPSKRNPCQPTLSKPYLCRRHDAGAMQVDKLKLYVKVAKVIADTDRTCILPWSVHIIQTGTRKITRHFSCFNDIC